MTGHIAHHSAKSLIFALPAPGSQPRRSPLAWDAAQPYRGLGFREIEAEAKTAGYQITELPVVKAADPPAKEQVVKVTAKKFEYSPSVITLKRGVPATLQLTSLDRQHGFACPALKLQAEINPGKVTEVKFTPDKVGEFPFHCSVFCGSGHEDMNGLLIVD